MRTPALRALSFAGRSCGKARAGHVLPSWWLKEYRPEIVHLFLVHGHRIQMVQKAFMTPRELLARLFGEDDVLACGRKVWQGVPRCSMLACVFARLLAGSLACSRVTVRLLMDAVGHFLL